MEQPDPTQGDAGQSGANHGSPPVSADLAGRDAAKESEVPTALDKPRPVARPTATEESQIGPEDLWTEEDEAAEASEVDYSVKPIEDTSGGDAEGQDKQWYILKVQSNRENSICDALRRQVAIRGLQEYFDEILVPTEDVAEFKNGKRRVVKRKLYPGYIVVRMALTEETWFVVRETPGIGDFTGASGKPSPMLPAEIEPILRLVFPSEESAEPVKTAIPFKLGDRVRIKDGTFENFEGEVEGIDEANGRVTVIINIFGRSTPVELEHWQVEMV